MINIAPSPITNPLILAAFVVAGWVLWRRFQRVHQSGGLLAMGGWLVQFAIYACLLVACVAG